MREKRRSGEERSRGASDARVLVSDGTRTAKWRDGAGGVVDGWRGAAGMDGWCGGWCSWLSGGAAGAPPRRPGRGSGRWWRRGEGER